MSDETVKAPCGCFVDHDEVEFCSVCNKKMCIYCYAAGGHIRGICKDKDSVKK